MTTSARLTTALMLISIGLWSFTATVFAAGNITVEDAWIREAPPNANVLAAYFQVENPTDTDIRLTKVSSDAFKKIEMHNTLVSKEGVASMKEQTQVVVPAKGKVAFKPGGLHLMLIGPEKRLKSGNTVDLLLAFSNGHKIRMTTIVKKAAAQMHHHHDNGHDNEHGDGHGNGHKQHSGSNGHHQDKMQRHDTLTQDDKNNKHHGANDKQKGNNPPPHHNHQ